MITTRENSYRGQPIRVTMDIEKGGSIKVTAVDEAGKQLSVAKPITENVTDAELRWDRKIEANSVRLRFELSGARVYSFQIP